MKFDSKYFDKIRVKPSADKILKDTVPNCEWPGCERPSRHKAPKGRGFEGQFFNYCTAHVQEYNKSYNYFNGMGDDAVRDWQKDAQTGHRPTWKLGQNSSAIPGGARRKSASSMRDPFGLLGEGGTEKKDAPKKRSVRNAELKALHTLGLDETATGEQAKTKYKTLVKRLHPDANGGSRANEDTLKSVIQAYDYLKTSGFC